MKIIEATHVEPQVKIISTHIPKTAGISFIATMEKVVGPSRILNLNNQRQSNKFHRRSDYPLNYSKVEAIRSKLAKHPSILHTFNQLHKLIIRPYIHDLDLEIYDPETFTIIHGHFNTMDVATIYPNAYKVTILRDPFQRIVSEYYYWKRKKGETGFTAPAYYETMSLLDYIHVPITQNRMTRQLGGTSLKDFAIVGDVSDISGYITGIIHLLNQRPGVLPTSIVMNKCNTPVHATTDAENIFNRLNYDDIEMYASAKQK